MLKIGPDRAVGKAASSSSVAPRTAWRHFLLRGSLRRKTNILESSYQKRYDVRKIIADGESSAEVAGVRIATGIEASPRTPHFEDGLRIRQRDPSLPDPSIDCYSGFVVKTW